ncbi:MAG: carboxypeptidase M32 [Rickettsiaceae bacterium]|nr:carboxypeptidase M32 [Rickettsiaceae bacterium]
MNHKQAYIELEKIFEEIAQLNNIQSLAHWDFDTYLPEDSANSRQQELATLSTFIHKLKSSDKVGELITKALQVKDTELDRIERQNLSLIKKQYDQTKIIAPELQKQYSYLSNETRNIWAKCKKTKDYYTLVPYLNKLFSVIREVSAIKADYLKISQYDALLDDFDPQRRDSEIQEIFTETRKELPNLINKIIAKQKTEKYLPITEQIDKKTQRAIELRLMEILGFNMKKGRLDETIHPFCSGNAEDTRITTKYKEDNFLDSSFSVMHEVGHALYQQNLPRKYHYQPVGADKGMSFHESQSLITEMQIGTSREFIEFYAKLLRDEFGFKGREYSAENLFLLKTRVIPNLIRIESDEVTYPLHVIIRYEIEKQIIDEQLDAAELPALWNIKLKEYLDIVPTDNFNGCVQDIHWPSGTIGYFPCYYIGAIIASMVMKKMREQNSKIDQQIASGNFEEINDYMNKNFRNCGSIYDSETLLAKATGHQKLSSKIFLDYLKDKYL